MLMKAGLALIIWHVNRHYINDALVRYVQSARAMVVGGWRWFVLLVVGWFVDSNSR